MDPELNFQTAVRSQNLRMTHQRRLVLGVLEQSREHLDAESIHDEVRRSDPRISLATVYRTLTLLKSMGLVYEHKLGEEHGHFEAAEETPHYHFTCNQCHKVIEFDAPQVRESVIPLLESRGVQVEETHLALYGLCPECRQSGRPKSGTTSLQKNSRSGGGADTAEG